MPAEPAPPFLTPTQRRLTAFALTFLSLLGIFALLIGAVMLLGQLVGFFSSLLADTFPTPAVALKPRQQREGVGGVGCAGGCALCMSVKVVS